MPRPTQPKLSDVTKPTRRRLSPDARKAEIISAAIDLFADTGFAGSTRDVARAAGITQPLLYRYFPNKDSLIEAVYTRVFLESWDPAWDALLEDREVSVRDRFQRFYDAYTEAIFDPVWLRLWHFALLRDGQIHEWYSHVVEEQILKPLVRERRIELGRDQTFVVLNEDLDAAWLLHGGLLNYGLRQTVQGTEDRSRRADVINQALDMFMLTSEAQGGDAR